MKMRYPAIPLKRFPGSPVEMQVKFRWCFLVLLMLRCCLLDAQTEQYHFKKIGEEEGALSTGYNGIAVDPKGYIWLAGTSGIIRYNGRDFEARPVNPNTICKATIYDITVDGKGNIWGANFKGQVFCISNDSLVIPGLSDSLFGFLEKGKKLINQLGFDAENRLWIGSVHSMTTAEPGENYSRIHIHHEFIDSVNTVIRVIGKGQSIMSKNRTEKPSARYPKGNGVTIYPEGYSVNCQVIFRDGTSRFFQVDRKKEQRSIPTGESTELSDGSVLFSMGATLYHAYADGKIESFEAPEKISHLSQDRLGNIWVGTFVGLLRFKNNSLAGKPDLYLYMNKISGVLLDHEYGLWVTTADNGVYYTPNIYHSFFNEKPGEANISGGIAAGVQHGLLGFSMSGGVYSIDSLNRMNFHGLSNEISPWGFIRKGKRNYGWGRGLFLFDDDYRNPRQVSNLKLTGATYDRDSSLLFLTAMNIYRMVNDSLVQVCDIPEGKSGGIARTPDGKVWVSSQTTLFNLEGDKLVNASVIRNGKDTIGGSRCLYVDRLGNLYVPTGVTSGGLFMLHNNEWYNIDSLQIPGITSTIRSLTVDDEGMIWGMNSKRVFGFYYDFKNRKVSGVVKYNWISGLCSPLLTNLGTYNGRVYIATANGVSIIEKNRRNYNRSLPPSFIDVVEINGKAFKPAAVNVLPYKMNSFRFFVHVLNYQARGKPLYKYRLVGFDDTFQKGSDASVYYSNLAPGDYLFVVIGINNNGFESYPVKLRFTIRPPFWLTWWFISLSVLFGAAAVFLFIRFRIRRIRMEEEEKTRINNLLAVSQMTALRAQMNPHFIFNAMNSIQNFILRNERETAYDYMAKFARLIRQVLHHTKDETVSITDEIDTLLLYTDIEKLRFDNVFTVDVFISPEIAPAETLIPGMLLQPFVENAIWHGLVPLHKTRPGKITIRFLPENGQILIQVEDNGVGRGSTAAKSAGHRSMGIEISRRRISLFAQQNKSTFRDIVFIDKKDEYGNPAGTLVEIRIADIH